LKVQKLNKEGITSFRKKMSERERRKEMRRRKKQQPIFNKFGEGINM
jgi:hypothetical protein